MDQAYVAAGSNVRPLPNLRRALALLSREFPGLRTSRAFANPAVGFVGDEFVNLVAAFPSALSPEALHARLKSIERDCGRQADAPKWGPRTLDLDLLLLGDRVGDFGGVRLPHPDVATRPWVLGPLADLAPALHHPVLGETMGELWRRFDRDAHPMREVSLEGAT